MIRVHTIPLSKAETRVLNRLARRDFEARVQATVGNRMPPEGKAAHVMQAFDHFQVLAAAMGWPVTELQSTYRHLPESVVHDLLDLVHECRPEDFEENGYREYVQVAEGLAARLQEALGIKEEATEVTTGGPAMKYGLSD